MRRLTSATTLVTTIAVMAGIVGCSNDGADDGDNKVGSLISIIINDPNSPYWKAEGDLAAAAAKDKGYTAKVLSHNGDQNKEKNAVDAAIANKSAAIILDPADANGSVGSVQRAMNAGIPTILVNAEINRRGIALAQLVSNNTQGAALGAEEWVRRMGEGGTYVEILGDPSDNNAATRSNGYETVISQYPDLKKVGEDVATNWDRTVAYNKMQSLLQVHPDIEGVLPGADPIALGAIAALKGAGRANDVVVGGFDGSPDALDAIRAGDLAYTVLQPVAVFTKTAIDIADANIRTGEKPKTEKQAFDCVLITKDNVDKVTSPFVYSG